MGENKQTRLCHIVKRDDFDGYGFNLHAEKGKPGQYIGKVDDQSPAEVAGLKQGDRIIEVNGVNIGNETHKQVVQRIKAISDEVQLLVIDPTIAFIPNNNEVVDGNKANNSVTSTTTPSSDHIDANDTTDAVTATTNGKNGQSPNSNKSNDSHAHNPTMNTSLSMTTTTTAAVTTTTTTTATATTKGANSEGLNLTMTAAELRAKLAAKKKYDPKSDTVDLRKKYEIVQKL
ncbi:Na(+)/H(+) exchange regulatory cofactor NHE-RF2 [Contarinia nasturtii]|uniref:Na(+)/H(+) exchange regulatory cofactor NHE-RF2 n=1 Tax=Contarinia nasturtii TaxID=265458 RepID=UPI0012D40956|nr:Na(+)/H(+) exchange regulatory cofactor NHE-RF2 [Contarinia nasturtii]XP_031641243.1 Na(+)/H(+) exchange regulatory cofactor NHE-RF2 [Contarinia nasturtii]XP_031641244.1 Na(+)/H(+) exchange regulatory cofactor NHE-RF2 [Contarinia nasturtii]XP_031641246.1 Na(+)/H(+) exchange regulatory cofactor NHE-RF2 [Contarinia nasturtii]